MRSTESGFNELVYLAAAQERVTEANLLLLAEPPQHVMASYVSGVAVECLFHAYRIRAGTDDTAKHDLRLHAELGSFYDGMTRRQREAVAALISEIVSRWQNNHRYRSWEALREFVLKHKLHVTQGRSTTREDVVQYNSEQLVNAATEIISIGVLRWDNS
ncbi:MAG: hypothetical protein V4671_23950 [Armatimonadota bacterium]